MKNRFTQAICGLSLALIIAVHPSALGQEQTNAPSLEGTWKWTFTMPDGGLVTPRLKLKRDGDQLTGTSRFRAGTETPVTNLTVNGDEVSFQVVRERDGQEITTRYTGKWNGDAISGKVVSNWNGEDQTYDWEARRLTDAEGTWKWTTTFGEVRSESTLKLKQEGEKISGKIRTRRAGTDTEIQHGKFKAGEISFQVERKRDGEKFVSRYYGKISGDKIQGKMELNFFGRPRTNNWEAIRVD